MGNICKHLPGLGFPGSSAAKESACNSGDPGLNSGSGRSPGEEMGYPFQYSWASLVAQMVKNAPIIQETLVWFLGQEDPLEKGKATQSSILAWRSSWAGEPGRQQSQGSQRVGYNWEAFTSLFPRYQWCIDYSLGYKMLNHKRQFQLILCLLNKYRQKFQN